MSYVDETLLPGETLEYRARVHRWIYVVPLLWLLAGGALVGGGSWLRWGLDHGGVPPAAGWIALFWLLVVAGGALVAWGLVGAGKAFVYAWSTELAVTSQRVVAKSGFIRRDTWELQRDKLESVSVDQSLLGRVLNFGTVELQGTGGGSSPLNLIAQPLSFRRAALTDPDLAGLPPGATGPG